MGLWFRCKKRGKNWSARVDGLDEVNKIVYELKPDNLNAINRGLKQLDRYLDILGDDWIGILLTYN